MPLANKLRFSGTAALVIVAVTASLAENPATSTETVVKRIEQVQADARNSVRPYSVTREYRLLKGDRETESQVMAEVSFVPPHKKDYHIHQAVGSGQGSKVVKKVLEHESEMTERWAETAVTRDNYDFAVVRQEPLRGRMCYVVQLSPKRESKELIRGLAWVDARTFRIMKVSGTPSKSPSWWIKRVQITLEYGEVNGMWLQRSTRAQADVRIIGRRTLTARDVSYRTGSVLAANSGKRTRSTATLASTIN